MKITWLCVEAAVYILVTSQHQQRFIRLQNRFGGNGSIETVLALGCQQVDVVLTADIQRTEFGIPHITAKNYKGLGYGVGYAFAEDNICSLAREIVIAKGESMRYLGDKGDIDSDVFYTWYNSDAKRKQFLDAQEPEVLDAVAGYAAGYSRYLRDKGVDNIDPDCAGAEWVREITTDDLLALYGKANLRGGLSNFVTPIATAAPQMFPSNTK